MMGDRVILYLIVWLGAGLHHAHESLQRYWCSVLLLSLGKVIEMRRFCISGGKTALKGFTYQLRSLIGLTPRVP